MKKIQKLIVITGLFVFIFFGAATSLHAQTDPGCDPLGGGVRPDGSPCPIDGGVVALLILGAAYGVKKVADHRKSETQAL